ncbi:MAG: hypothetical protein GY754_16330 [bacterium]|nr:hypothetical protein [bacterium]
MNGVSGSRKNKTNFFLKEKQYSRLGDFCFIKHGYPFKGKYMTIEDDSSLPVIVNIVNFKYNGGFRFESTKVQRYTGDYPVEYELTPGDMLLVMTCQTAGGEILGVPARILDDDRVYLHNQRLGLVVLKNNVDISLDFLYWVFLSPDFNRYLNSTATGTKVIHTAPARIEQYQFLHPPVPVQRKISAILSLYDSYYHINHRRIMILEEMCWMIYREWFINYRFPGYNEIEMVDSSRGKIPKGWKLDKVKTIIKRVKSGCIYKESMVTAKGLVPVIRQAREDSYTYHNNDPDHRATAEKPIILFGDHTCTMQLMVEPFSLAPNIVPFVSKTSLPEIYLFFLLSNLVETREYKRHWTELSNKVIVIASYDEAMAFNNCITPLFELANILKKNNAILKEKRDLILPKIISGSIDVSDLDITMKEEDNNERIYH